MICLQWIFAMVFDKMLICFLIWICDFARDFWYMNQLSMSFLYAIDSSGF